MPVTDVKVCFLFDENEMSGAWIIPRKEKIIYEVSEIK